MTKEVCPACRSRMAIPSPPNPLPMISTSKSLVFSCRVRLSGTNSDNMRFQDTVDNKACQDGLVTFPAAPVRRHFRGVSPEERQAQRRERLVEAGLDAFGARGFHGVGVRDVCALAKLTERYFYESFENREALFLAVYQEAARRIRVAVATAHAKAEPSPSAFARSGLEATLRSFRDDPRLARILLLEVFAVGSAIGEARFDVSQAFADDIAAIAKGFHPSAADTGISPELIANG